MHLANLKVSHLRNIDEIHLTLSSQVNVIIGENGSGKTSLLEAMYSLGYGRSFRTHTTRPMIQDNAAKNTVFGVFIGQEQRIPVGIERLRQGSMTIRFGGKTLQSVAELVKHFPMQLISPDSYKVLEEGPTFRRQYLDWGVFHVEHDYLSVWKRFQRVLKQRNAVLREGGALNQITVWDHDLISSAEQIHTMRENYFNALKPMLEASCEHLFPDFSINIRYERGWDEEQSLESQIVERLARDCSLGYTSVGPQRADLKVSVDFGTAKHHLSRGQQKRLVCALLCIQAKHLCQTTDKKPLLLVDDLCSELDPQGAKALLQLLTSLNSQIVITSIEQEPLLNHLKDQETALFHVEQGRVTRAETVQA